MDSKTQFPANDWEDKCVDRALINGKVDEETESIWLYSSAISRFIQYRNFGSTHFAKRKKVERDAAARAGERERGRAAAAVVPCSGHPTLQAPRAALQLGPRTRCGRLGAGDGGAALCSIEYPAATVLYFDTEHNFSAKRIFEIAITRVRLRNVHSGADADMMAKEIVKRIRLVKIDSLGKFIHNGQLIHEGKLLITHEQWTRIVWPCVMPSTQYSLSCTAINQSNDQTPAQRQHQMLKLTRDLKLLADTHQAFVVVTNRASTGESAAGLYTRPHLGETWAHCVSTRIVLERYPQHRGMTIVKSPVAGYVVQPYAIDESGVQASVDEAASSTVETDNFDVHDDLFYDLASLPMVEPSCTLRSTQKSSVSEENDGESLDESNLDLFDLVSDSNDEDDEYDKSIGDLREDR
ncbi:hypothetical protein FI667_g6145, partial [Globisporangium splendens]